MFRIACFLLTINYTTTQTQYEQESKVATNTQIIKIHDLNIAMVSNRPLSLGEND
jgi:hypothetical protein